MTRTQVFRYARAPVAIFISVWLENLIGPGTPFLLLWPAIVACAWFGGFGPGLFATLLGILAADYFVIEPRYIISLHKVDELPWACLVLVVGLCISILSERVIRSKQRAERLIAELNSRAEALALADRSKSDFMAALGHELRGPLGAARTAAQVLHQLSATAPAALKASAIIERQLVQMARLVDDLLDMSRASRGKLELERERVDVATIVDLAIETSRWLIESRQHELTISPAPRPVWIHADPKRLAQVLRNLLDNAAKYTESPGHIWLTVSQEGDEVIIQVRDNGQGIASDMLPKVFDLYTQVGGRSHGGLGIGLSLARRLVELHGGQVEAHSAGPCQGSSFIVRLPVEFSDCEKEVVVAQP